jgi:hypothetical protein
MKSIRKSLGKQYHSQEPEKLKFLGINVKNKVTDLYSENCKSLKKENV